MLRFLRAIFASTHLDLLGIAPPFRLGFLEIETDSGSLAVPLTSLQAGNPAEFGVAPDGAWNVRPSADQNPNDDHASQVTETTRPALQSTAMPIWTRRPRRAGSLSVDHQLKHPPLPEGGALSPAQCNRTTTI